MIFAQVNLTEDGFSTGRFTGSIETRIVDTPTLLRDPYIGVQEGDTLIVTFEDFNAAPGGIKVRDTITMTPGPGNSFVYGFL